MMSEQLDLKTNWIYSNRNNKINEQTEQEEDDPFQSIVLVAKHN